MTTALLDDHLLRDVLADRPSAALRRIVRAHDLATTNLYLYRLCRSVSSARGGSLTGAWAEEYRRALGRRLVSLPSTVRVVPMQQLAFRMGELSASYRVSTLGAEAAAAAEFLSARLYVWDGDDGPGIRSAVEAVGCRYQTVRR